MTTIPSNHRPPRSRQSDRGDSTSGATRRWLMTLALLVVPGVGCSSEQVSETTARVVGKAVETGKGLTKGVAEGVSAGRKEGESVDGAVLVSSHAELAPHGRMWLAGTAGAAEPDAATVTVIVQNDADHPLRLVALHLTVLDVDGFTPGSSTQAGEMTVPAKSKLRVALPVKLAPERIGEVRVWGETVSGPAKEGAEPAR